MSWASRKQKSVALNTAEEKYIAYCKCVEPAQNRSRWELTYTVAKKIEEKRSRRE